MMSEAEIRAVMKMEPEELMDVAREYQRRAYVPYSNFPVGAAVLTEGGAIWGGCNVENASYGLSICAERVAICKAVAEGSRRLVAIAVTGPDGAFCPPCGACRQFIAEFGPDAVVLLDGGGELRFIPVAELLPHCFRIND